MGRRREGRGRRKEGRRREGNAGPARLADANKTIETITKTNKFTDAALQHRGCGWPRACVVIAVPGATVEFLVDGQSTNTGGRWNSFFSRSIERIRWFEHP